MLKRTGTALTLILLLGALVACSNDDDSGDGGAQASATCEYAKSTEGSSKPVDLPAGSPEQSGDIEAVIATSAGDIPITLDADAAPCTVNSFLSLVEQDFYDDTECHRLGNLPGFSILQCGDPDGLGTGGPGYTYADELTGEETYPAGTLAMANAGADTNGSQFFLVFGDSQFDPNYTVFGTISEEGIQVLNAIGEKGHDGSGGTSGRPTAPVEITGVTIAE